MEGYDKQINDYDKYIKGYYKYMKVYEKLYINGCDKYMKGYDKQINNYDRYIKGSYKYITGYNNYIDAYDKYTKDFLEKIFTAVMNIFTAMPKKYLQLLCPLYQWSVELGRQNGGGGGRLRGHFSSRSIPSLFRQAEQNLQSDNINV